MEHINWADPDNIILANSSSDPAYKKINDDVQKNGVKEIRHLKVKITKNTYKSYFRYVVNKEVVWFYISNDETKNRTYYTFIYIIEDNEVKELNNSYRLFDREDKLNKLLK